MFSHRWATDEVPGISIMFGECYSSQDWALLLQFGQRLELGRERARNHQAVVDPGGGPEAGRDQRPKLSVGALGQFPEIGTVPVRQRDALARRGQTLGGVLANEIQHPEARGTCPALHRQQRFIHQALDLVEDLAGNDGTPGTHRRGGFQVEAPEKTDNRRQGNPV
jgi:hypothetical protein